MKRLVLFLGIWLFPMLVWGSSIPEFYYYNGVPYYLTIKSNELYIRVAPSVNSADVDALLAQKIPYTIRQSLKGVQVYDRVVQLVETPALADVQQLLDGLNADADIVVATVMYLHNRVRQAVSDEFIVQFQENTSQEQIDALNAQYGTTMIRQTLNGSWVLKAPKGVDGMTMANQYVQESIVAWAEPNFIYPGGDLLHAVVNDPLWPSQWAHKNTGQSVSTGASAGPATVNGSPDADMDVDQAWDHTTGSNVIVAIVDTGTDLDHPDLQANIVNGYDPTENDSIPNDDTQGHGTATSGVVGAVGNNNLGVAGIAYGAKIMPIRIFDDGGNTQNTWIGDGINWAWQNGADILSNSWGGGSPATEIDNAIQNARTNGRNGKGCIQLFSSGNDGHDPVEYPAYLTNVLAVGASSMFDEKKNPGSTDQQHWWGGNYGADLDIVAPTIVYTTDIAGADGYNSGDYDDTFNGTSAACPNAAGVAALALSADTNLTVSQMEDILKKTADKVEKYTFNSAGWNRHVGYGRVNAYKAVLAALGQDATHPVIVHTPLRNTPNTGDMVVSADIYDDTGIATGSLQPTLYYRVDTGSGFGAWQSVTDADGPTGATYQFVIPGQPLNTTVQYYLVAYDASANNNKATYPFGADVAGVTGNAATPFTFRISSETEKTYTNSTTLSMGLGTNTTTITIPDNFVVTDVDLVLNGTGSNWLAVSLESPSGNRAGPFVNNSGTSGWNNTVLDDEATATIASGSSPYSGSFQPDNGLWAFKGENASGTWTLRLYADANVTNFLSLGDLTSWSLIFNGDPDLDQGLPIQLLAFQGVYRSGAVELRWKTASEINNVGFEIWRALENGPFAKIASYETDPGLQGAGNSNEENRYVFTDRMVESGRTYQYKLVDVDVNGQKTVHGPIRVVTAPVDVDVVESGELPREFDLKPAFPNPFNPSTTIRFAVPVRNGFASEEVTLAVFDNLGRKVRTLFQGPLAPGVYQLQWDGQNDAGQAVATGTYYVLYRGRFDQKTQRVLFMK